MSKCFAIYLALAASVIAPTAAAAMSFAPTAEMGGVELTLVQGCPRGYDYDRRTRRCYRNVPDAYRGGRGYYRAPGCPYGYNPLPDGRCAPAGGAWCPRGWNAIYGRCYPAQ